MKKQRVLSFVLSLCIVASLLPTTALAAKTSDFTDVSRNSWYYQYVDFVTTKGYFTGTSATTFSPDVTMTRAMFVVVLSQLDGVEINNNVAPFADVKAGSWYAGAVKWAAENQIVSGVGGNRFDPDGAITREQMCVIMDQFIEYYSAKTGKTHATDGSSAAFPDAASISTYAKEAVAKCRLYGLIDGFEDGTFRPKDYSTRAQVATVIYNLAWLVGAAESGSGGGGGGGGGSTVTPTATAYTITYRYNYAGSPADFTRETEKNTSDTKSYIVADAVSRDGYTFTGWNTAADGSGTLYAAGSKQTATGDLTLYAQWREKDPEDYSYTVTFWDGETKLGEVETVKDLSETKAFTTLGEQEKSGYVFASWNIKADGTGDGYAAASSYTTDRDLNLYAQWLEDEDYIGIAFKAAVDQVNQEYVSRANITFISELEKAANKVNKEFGASLTFSSENTSTGGASIEPMAFNANPLTGKDNPRPQSLTAQAQVSEDLAVQIIEMASSEACYLLENVQGSDDLPSNKEVNSAVDKIIASVEGYFGIKLSNQTNEQIKEQVYQKVLAKGQSLWANFRDEDGNYFTGDVIVSVGSTQVKVKVGTTTELVGSKQDAIVNLGTALAKEMYAGLKSVTSYQSVVELTGTVTFTFSPSATYGAATDKYPYQYPVTVGLTLDGGSLVEYKFNGESYVKLNITKGIQKAYHDEMSNVVESAMTNGALKSELAARANNALGNNQVIASLKSVLDGDVADENGDVANKIKNAVNQWVEANLQVPEEDTEEADTEESDTEEADTEEDAPKYYLGYESFGVKGDIKCYLPYEFFWVEGGTIVSDGSNYALYIDGRPDLSGKTLGDNTELYKLIVGWDYEDPENKDSWIHVDGLLDDVAEYAISEAEKTAQAEHADIWNNLSATGKAELIAAGIKTVLGTETYAKVPETVRNYLINLSAVKLGTVDPQDEELYKEYMVALKEDLTKINAMVDSLVMETFYGYNSYLEKAVKVRYVDTMADVQLGNLATLLNNQTFLAQVDKLGGDSIVNRVTNLLARIPAGASVKVGNVTLDKEALSGIQSASNASEACKALADLINSGLSGLKLSDFAGEGQEITVSYNSRTFSFNLVIEIA